MARKNIFQIIESKHDLAQEVTRLESLLDERNGIAIYKVSSSVLGPQFKKSMKIEEFVDAYAFKQWKSRGTCVDLADMFETLGLDEVFEEEEFDEEKVLIYAEYIANVLFLVKRVKLAKDYSYQCSDAFTALQENLNSLLGWLNYEQKVFVKQERVLVVKKSATVSAVAEIVDEDLAYQIVKYNHLALKGDIDSKKAILLALGVELEPKRKEIGGINKALEDGIFYMLNNLNIRHNNRSKNDKNYKEAVAKMRKNKLEEWYDELYQMMLLAFLELDQRDRAIRVAELKESINNG